MKTTCSLILLTLLPWLQTIAASLEEGFLNPPASTSPSCYWYWISDNISKEGITRDLEGMKQVGISEAFIGNIYLDNVKIGGVKALTEEWWGMVEHAIREGGRVGVKVGMFNCPGWSQSGGPWIKPEQAMRYVAYSETRVSGPAKFSGKLPRPHKDFQDIALLAFPAPAEEARKTLSPRITTSISLKDAEAMIDGKSDTCASIPAQPGFHVDLEFSEPITCRSLLLIPERRDFSLHCELQVEKGGSYTKVRSFLLDRSNNNISVGFVPYAPLAISFEPLTGSKFRLIFSGVSGPAGIAEIRLSGQAMIERYIEKQLGKMHPTPLPMWGDYSWPTTAEPGKDGLAVSESSVQVLTGKLKSDETLEWEAPNGEWIIMRAGLTPTGTKNAPASPQGQGLEVDKMNRQAAKAHFEAFIGELLTRFPNKSDRKALERVIADSYEMGSQNWTDGLREKFKRRYRYDPLPWLPTLTGRIVDTADKSERFLWDLRRLVADQVAYEYVGGLRDACREHGLKLWLENYGHWGFPAEFLQYGGQSDEVGGEFWSSGNLGSIELRAASSAAHIYGKPRVSAEAFTSTSMFESTPWELKRRGDWALTEGINHWVLHVNIHQPWEDKQPGVNAWFSTEFNRHTPWFAPGREFIDYYKRCHYLLQQGQHVADVAYFIGEDTPKMTGIRHPELPKGYNYDYINAEVILDRLTVKDGKFVLPSGMSYRVLALPPVDTMRPALLEKVSALVRAGGTVLGDPPKKSPSMEDYPDADRRVTSMAAKLWKDCDGKTMTSAKFGKGRVFRNVSLAHVFKELGVEPQIADSDDAKVLWTQRQSGDTQIFFLSNQSDSPASITPRFRAIGKVPELWDAATKRMSHTAVFSPETGAVQLDIEPRGSIFVIFRKSASSPTVVREVRHQENVVLSLKKQAQSSGIPLATGDTTNTFTIAGWVLPKTDIALPRETDTGVFIGERRNEVVSIPHGQSLFGSANHACAGVSVGRNGVVVYEHSGNYFAPILTHPAEIRGWTHFAVIYRDGKPELHLNGSKVHEGLKSKYIVHSGLAVGNNFIGKYSGIESLDGAISPEALNKLVQTPPPPEASLPAILLNRAEGGRVLAEVSSPGAYAFELGDDRRATLNIPSVPADIALGGPWEVVFPARRDVPTSMQLEKLQSLSEHPNAAVKYFSGTVSYRKAFEAKPITGDTLAYLDLGDVGGVAEVEVNGKPAGILWKPPYRANVTRLIQPGRNEVVVKVSGTWRNRLIGDAKYPNGFPDASGAIKPLEFKPFLTAKLNLSGAEGLLPSGLIGPVRILHTKEAPLPAP